MSKHKNVSNKYKSWLFKWPAAAFHKHINMQHSFNVS